MGLHSEIESGLSPTLKPGFASETIATRLGTMRLTGIRSGYFCLMRSPSAFRFSTIHWIEENKEGQLSTDERNAEQVVDALITSYTPKGCSSLNFDRIVVIQFTAEAD